MEFAAVVARLVVIVGAMLGVATLWLVGPERLKRALAEWQPRTRSIVPFLAILGGVIVLRLALERIQVWLSWRFGVNITGTIYAVEGTLVATVQSFQTQVLTELLIFMYLYGYVFLLVFPMIAYFCLDDMRPLSELFTAFAINYAIGVLLYTLFVAYGPRNLLLDVVDPLLYTVYPQSRALTNTVNHNVNVFPSLHTSLSVTALLMAWRTRESYPRWVPIAAVLAGGVVLSTMYLAIHWALDVVAGVILAAVSVYAAIVVVERYDDIVDDTLDKGRQSPLWQATLRRR